jgi:hypothetical protein
MKHRAARFEQARAVLLGLQMRAQKKSSSRVFRKMRRCASVSPAFHVFGVAPRDRQGLDGHAESCQKVRWMAKVGSATVAAPRKKCDDIRRRAE